MNFFRQAVEILSGIALCIIIAAGSVYVYSEVHKKNIYCDSTPIPVNGSIYKQCVVEQ